MSASEFEMNKIFWLFLAGLNCCCVCVLHDKLTAHLLFEQHVLLAVNVASKKDPAPHDTLLSSECMEETLALKLPYFLVQYSKGNHAVQAGSNRLRQDAGEVSKGTKQGRGSVCSSKNFTEESSYYCIFLLWTLCLPQPWALLGLWKGWEVPVWEQ